MPGKKTILLVEDHAAMRQAASILLLDAFPTASVVVAANGLEAIELAGRLRPDLIVMDNELPYMGGVEATRRIKAVCPATKIVFFSFSDTPSCKREAEEAGADGYVCKEEGFDRLLETLASFL